MQEIRDWNIATNKVTTLFIKKYFGDCDVGWIKNFYWEEDGTEFTAGDGAEDGIHLSGYWVSEEIGGVLEIADYYFNFSRIKEALELEATEDQLFEYYDLEFDREGKVGYNFKNFVRYGKEQMEKITNEKICL